MGGAWLRLQAELGKPEAGPLGWAVRGEERPSRGLPVDGLSPLQVTEEVHRLLRRGSYRFVCRGKVSVKGKGEMLTYFLEGRTDGNGAQTRSLNSERKMCPYGRAGLQTRLAAGHPPVPAAAGLPVGPGPGALQGSGLAPVPPGQHLAPGASGKEA